MVIWSTKLCMLLMLKKMFGSKYADLSKHRHSKWQNLIIITNAQFITSFNWYKIHRSKEWYKYCIFATLLPKC